MQWPDHWTPVSLNPAADISVLFSFSHAHQVLLAETQYTEMADVPSLIPERLHECPDGTSVPAGLAGYGVLAGISLFHSIHRCSV